MSDKKLKTIVVVVDDEALEKLGKFFNAVMMTEGKAMIQVNPLYFFASKIAAYLTADKESVSVMGEDLC